MPKIELTVTDAEKEQIKRAAERAKLRPATWAKAKLLLAAMQSSKEGAE